MRRAFAVVLFGALAACAPASREARGAASALDQALPGTDGAGHRIRDLVSEARFTAIVFFSADCPCQRAHDPRLVDIATAYRSRGVRIVAVDAEATGSPVQDRREAQARGYPFPILSDPEGRTADALGATFATYTVVMDAAGHVHYRGGLDSDRKTMTAGASLWLKDALDRLLEGRAPEPAETEGLGCALRRR